MSALLFMEPNLIDVEWQLPTETLLSPTFVSGQELHVWRCNLQASYRQVDLYWNVLAPDEQARALRFRFERHRTNFVVSRGNLRLILAHYLLVPPGDLTFSYNTAGKPLLRDHGDLTLSVSHTDDLCVSSIGYKRQHGIDIESLAVRATPDNLVPHVLSHAERDAYWVADPTQRTRLFLSLWTQKEAYLKAIGTGLVDHLQSVDCAQLAAHWAIVPFTPNAQHVGALCIKGPPAALWFLESTAELWTTSNGDA